MDDNLHIFAPVVSMVTHSQFWELLIIWEQPERDWPMAIAFNVPEFLDRSIVLMLPMSLGSRRWVGSNFSHVSVSTIYKLQCQLSMSEGRKAVRQEGGKNQMTQSEWVNFVRGWCEARSYRMLLQRHWWRQGSQAKPTQAAAEAHSLAFYFLNSVNSSRNITLCCISQGSRKNICWHQICLGETFVSFLVFLAHIGQADFTWSLIVTSLEFLPDKI